MKLNLIVVSEGKTVKHLVNETVFQACVAWAGRNITHMTAQTFYNTDGEKFCLFGKHLLAVFGEGLDDWQDRSMTNRHAEIFFPNTQAMIKMTDVNYEELMQRAMENPEFWENSLSGFDAAQRMFVLSLKQICSISRVPNKSDENMGMGR